MRLTADIRISAMRRLAEQQGGFATVIRRGDKTSGDIVLTISTHGGNPRLFGRQMTLEGDYTWAEIVQKDAKDQSGESYLARATARDPDLWILEVDIADPARFIERLTAIN